MMSNPTPPSAPRRATAALAVVLMLMAYITIAWVIGDMLLVGSRWWQMLYYPVAGILWVPVAFWIIKKIYKS